MTEPAFDLDVAREAAMRWTTQEKTFRAKERASGQGRYTQIDTRERLAKRANRLLDAVRECAPETMVQADPDLRAMLVRPKVLPEDVTNITMERIINSAKDFLGVRFFGGGEAASRAVCRLRTVQGSQESLATGFLVSPNLLLTNFHVLNDASSAANTVAQFGYELDLGGDPEEPEEFGLDPGRFFLSDKDLDFALVAIKPQSRNLVASSRYGYCSLIADEGKIVPGEPVNIIQHPRGGLKQVVIRDNKLLDLPTRPGDTTRIDRFAQYQADTDRGSSGSPVFNDEWEVFALHHSGVPKLNADGQFVDRDGAVFDPKSDPSRIVWIGNEGIRISRLIAFVKDAPLRPEFEALRAELLSAKPPQGHFIENRRNAVSVDQSPPKPEATTVKEPQAIAQTLVSASKIDLTIPLRITIALGAMEATPSNIAIGVGTAAGLSGGFDTEESAQPDPDYRNRPGFNTDFLGFKLPLPRLQGSISRLASHVEGGGVELKYNNYSVIMNAKRRLAFVSAVNLNGNADARFKREAGDKWFFDPRIDEREQIGNALYLHSDFDHGHLTRRDDAAWGRDQDEARRANDDTFHFTNCSPQHKVFNREQLSSKRGVLLWGDIEKHIQREASQNGRLCVFNGPIFRDDDPVFRDVLIPREFWKVVVSAADAGGAKAFAFKLSQQDLIDEIPAEEFRPGRFVVFQLKLRELEDLTGLDFRNLSQSDPLENAANENLLEADSGRVMLRGVKDIIL